MSKEQLELFSVSLSDAQRDARPSPCVQVPATKVTTKPEASPQAPLSSKAQAPTRKPRSKPDASDESPPVFLTVRSVAARYEVCVPTIWRWIKTSPNFPHPLKLGQGTTRWSLADLLRYEHDLKKSVRKEKL